MAAGAARPPRCLIACLGIDRDADVLPRVIDAVLTSCAACAPALETDILVITRASDGATRAAWAAHAPHALVHCVPHYDIERGRHAFERIAAARGLALRTARNGGYDAVWFIDSDVVPRADTLAELWRASSAHGGWDAVGAPYRVRWCGFPAVAVLHREAQPPCPTRSAHADEGAGVLNAAPSRLRVVDGTKLECGGDGDVDGDDGAGGVARVHALGFGCTLLRGARALEVPCAVVGVRDGAWSFVGEDVGYFLAAAARGMRVGVLPRHEVPHLFDRREQS